MPDTLAKALQDLSSLANQTLKPSDLPEERVELFPAIQLLDGIRKVAFEALAMRIKSKQAKGLNPFVSVPGHLVLTRQSQAQLVKSIRLLEFMELLSMAESSAALLRDGTSTTHHQLHLSGIGQMGQPWRLEMDVHDFIKLVESWRLTSSATP